MKNLIKRLEEQLKAAKATEAFNKKFKAMTKPQKRVAIAKDVIAQVKLEKYRTTPGQYFSYMSSDAADSCGGDAQQYLVGGGSCDVCALGAIFASTVKVKNTVTLVDADRQDNESIAYYLKGIFDRKQLGLIEAAFEREHRFAETEAGCTYEAAEAAVVFGLWYPENSKRMIAIMQNIVKNNGTFKP